MPLHPPVGLDELNALGDIEARQALLGCCSSTRWANGVGAGRPYATPKDLYAAAEVALADMDESDLDEAMAGHPRIGERAEGEHAGSSRLEQSSVSSASAATIAALAEANTRYEARFGHVYLVCADGRSGEELLAVLRERLEHDSATERTVARAELGRINRIRLGRLLGADDPEPGR